jgi:Tol biopolymer transport system component
MALAPGIRLGPYEVLAPLGAGGMGEVWRARDTRLGRDVAIKVLPDHLAYEARALARFQIEVRALAALSHPGILSIFDVGHEGTVAYAVTELLEGETLRAALRRGPLPWREAVDVATAVAEALAAAHDRGFVHRDLKPENLFLCAGGRPKVLDFGLARREASSPEATTDSIPDVPTAPGALVGTVGYMAPEQLRGLAVDHRADVFAFGCVLYEMLAGRRAFPGRTSSEVIAAILHVEPARLVVPSGAAPPALGEVVARCLRKDPDQRFTSARDVAFALRAVASGSVPAGSVVPRPRRRGRLAASLAAVAAAGGLFAFLLARGSGLPELLPRQVTSGPGCESEPALSPDGESVAFLADTEGRADLWIVDSSGGRPLRLTDGPGPAASPVWHPDGRSLFYVSGIEGAAEIRKVPRFGGPPQTVVRNARDPAVSPDGRAIAFSREGAKGMPLVWLAPLGDPERARPVSGDPPGVFEHRQPAWSPDGRTICYRDFHDLWLLPAGGGSAHTLTRDEPADFDPVFSPDGRHVYFASYRDGTRALWRVSVDGGTPERVTLGTGMETRPSLSRDGRRLAYATRSEGHALVLVERESGERTRLEESRLVGFASLDPFGRFVVYTSSRENAADLWVTPLEDGRPAGEPRRLTELGGRAACPAVSPDGRWIAFYLVRDRDRDVYVVPAEGGEPFAVAPHPGSDVLPAWTRDGTRLAFVSDRSGTEQVWAVAMKDGRPAGEPGQVTAASTWASFPRFLSDGRLVFLSGDSGGKDIRVAGPGTGGPSRQVTSGRVAWSAIPDRGGPTLLVLAEWGNGREAIRAVPVDGGDPVRVPWGTPPDLATEIQHFDLSDDGRLAVLLEETRRGDVWILEAGKGRRF